MLFQGEEKQRFYSFISKKDHRQQSDSSLHKWQIRSALSAASEHIKTAAVLGTRLLRVVLIRVVYILGELNRGVDIMSRGGPHQGDHSLHPNLASQIWSKSAGQRWTCLLHGKKCPLLHLEHVGQSSAGSGHVCALAVAQDADQELPDNIPVFVGLAAEWGRIENGALSRCCL